MYDLIHQILTGNVDGGLARELAVSLFRDARLMDRIVEGQRMNDVATCVYHFIIITRKEKLT